MFSDFCGVRTQVLPEGRLELGASVVTIGAFDGMHLGHQALVRRMVAEARALGLPSVVWTFDPPPRVFFTGVQQLSTLDEKLVRMATIGPDHIVVASFTETYRQRSAEDFIEGLRRIGPARILVGADFRFGAQQTGDVELLARHFDVKVFDPVRCRTARSSPRRVSAGCAARGGATLPILFTAVPTPPRWSRGGCCWTSRHSGRSSMPEIDGLALRKPAGALPPA